MRHRYPWSVEEIAILTVLELTAIGAAGWAFLGERTGGQFAFGVVVAVMCLGLSVYLFLLGTSRKRRSEIVGTLSADHFRFSGGRFDSSEGSLAGFGNLRVRTQGPEKALVFSASTENGPDDEVVVPLRLVRANAHGRAELVAALQRNARDLVHNEQASRVLQDLQP